MWKISSVAQIYAPRSYQPRMKLATFPMVSIVSLANFVAEKTVSLLQPVAVPTGFGAATTTPILIIAQRHVPRPDPNLVRVAISSTLSASMIRELVLPSPKASMQFPVTVMKTAAARFVPASVKTLSKNARTMKSTCPGPASLQIHWKRASMEKCVARAMKDVAILLERAHATKDHSVKHSVAMTTALLVQSHALRLNRNKAAVVSSILYLIATTKLMTFAVEMTVFQELRAVAVPVSGFAERTVMDGFLIISNAQRYALKHYPSLGKVATSTIASIVLITRENVLNWRVTLTSPRFVVIARMVSLRAKTSAVM